MLKVGSGLPFRYPTVELYKMWDVLTVRQTFILQIVTMKHCQFPFNPNLMKGKRRKGNVCPSKAIDTGLARRFYIYLGSYLYNKINTTLSIYPLPKKECKIKISKFLKSLDYDQTEKLLTATK